VARAALMASIVLAPFWLQRPFDNSPTRWLAEQSYGIYLIHLVICWYVGIVWLDLPRDGTLRAALLWFAVVIPTSIGYAYLSRRFVEVPARRWILSWRGPRPQASTPPRLRHSDA
jgi:peptidoglycan/LPS O-acetylase OafA/YrhL